MKSRKGSALSFNEAEIKLIWLVVRTFLPGEPAADMIGSAVTRFTRPVPTGATGYRSWSRAASTVPRRWGRRYWLTVPGVAPSLLGVAALANASWRPSRQARESVQTMLAPA
jgi:hypothetical protein